MRRMAKSFLSYKESHSCYVVSGILNAETAHNLWQQSQDILKHDKDPLLIFNLEEVTQSDSSGVALLIAWMRLVQSKNKKIQFINLPKQMLAIIKVADLEKILPIKIVIEK